MGPINGGAGVDTFLLIFEAQFENIQIAKTANA